MENAIERYLITRKIDAGGMATVYLAQDKTLNRTVALKKLHPHLLENENSIVRFNNEAKAIALLNHENIIKIFDYGETATGPFLVMEYIDGITLEECLENNARLPNLVIIELARQVAAGLNCAHLTGIVHRDIKPANILIKKDGSVVITDFGIAYIANRESITMTGSLIGSPHFISPEQAQSKPISGKTDIFSLGVILYQCITGVLPFNGDAPHAVIYSIISANAENIRDKNPAVLFWLAELIESCLTKDQDLRPDASALLSKIDKKCVLNSLKVNKSSIENFIGSPVDYNRRETNELFARYRTDALNDLRSGKIISGLRKFEQAEVFCVMSSNDIKLKKTALHKGHRKTATATITLFFLIISGISILLLHLYRNNRNQDPTPQNAVNNMANNEIVPLPDKKVIIPKDLQEPIINEPLRKDDPARREQEVNRQTILSSTTPVTNKSKPDYLQVTPIKAIIKPGFLKVFTNPPWVTMCVDGIERGKTPKTNLVVLSEGEHELVLNKDLFIEYKNVVTIQASDTVTVRIRLEPQPRDQHTE